MSCRDLLVFEADEAKILLKELISNNIRFRRRKVINIDVDSSFIVIGGDCLFNNLIRMLFFYNNFHGLRNIIHFC